MKEEVNNNDSFNVDPKDRIDDEQNWKDEIINDKDNKWGNGSIKQDEIDYSKDKIPNYYKGQTYGYEARKVCEDFELSYNIGTAVTYLLRAEKKHETATQCIRKAINHLEFELDKIANKSIKKYK